MERKYLFDPEAEKELEEASVWHEENREGSGVQLVENVFEKVEQITNRPLSHSADADGVRRASIKKFPYFIYYIFKKTFIIILSVWHKKRQQEEWKKRLGKYT